VSVSGQIPIAGPAGDPTEAGDSAGAGGSAGAGNSAGKPAGAPTYLDRIVPSVIARLEARKRQVPLRELEATVTPRPRASLAEALKGPGVSLIAEVKRASPSRGPIRPRLEVGPLVRAYEAAGARAVSVLTEEEYFSGGPDDLRAAAAAAQLPVLRKDFIVDEYQIHEARAWGADAVLLIAALLSDEELHGLVGMAVNVGLDVLLEVHDRSEMLRALSIDEAIIGVNNRDLRTFTVSLATTLDLAGLVPPERLLVSESGIWTHADVVQLAACGVNGVLVGESLLRSPDVGAAVEALLRPAPVVARRSTVL
jgi:indole-3-glycerol phosphate synthase